MRWKSDTEDLPNSEWQRYQVLSVHPNLRLPVALIPLVCHDLVIPTSPASHFNTYRHASECLFILTVPCVLRSAAFMTDQTCIKIGDPNAIFTLLYTPTMIRSPINLHRLACAPKLQCQIECPSVLGNIVLNVRILGPPVNRQITVPFGTKTSVKGNASVLDTRALPLACQKGCSILPI